MSNARSQIAVCCALGAVACSNSGPGKPKGDPLAGDGMVAVGDTSSGDALSGDSAWQPPQVCNRTLTPPTTGTCQLSLGSDVRVIRGDLLLPTGILEDAELVIDAGGRIACAGCDCSGLAITAGATTLTCADGLVSPGLINTHDHIGTTETPPVGHGSERYGHRNEWRRGQNGKTVLSIPGNSHPLGDAWGEMRQVMTGTTSVVGGGGHVGFLRNLDREALLEGLQHAAAFADSFPLDDWDGGMFASGCFNYTITDAGIAKSRIAYLAHSAEGIGAAAHNELLCISGEASGSADLLFDTASIVQGIGVNAGDVARLSRKGVGLVWSPRANTSLYGETAPVPVYDRMGVRVALGTDFSATGSVNLLRELRCAESWSSRYWDGYFGDIELVSMVTDAAAELSGFGDTLGSLTVGRTGDVVIWDGLANWRRRAILDAGPENVVLVLRGGVPLYGDAALVSRMVPLGDCDALDVCGEQKSLCVSRELGVSLLALQADMPAGTYGLFFCGDPPGEPTCVPARPGEFDGSTSGADRDGDGLVDTTDNCPRMFNPARPLDGIAQADADADGLGDLCDGCPLSATSTSCAAPDPSDGDGDGVPNAIDNCPNLPNPLQRDRDIDGRGDVCDDCAAPNPGGSPCPTSIYDIKTGIIALGDWVVVDGAIVTAASDVAFWVTTDPNDPFLYSGADYASLFVWNQGGTEPAIGTEVRLTGPLARIFGRLQLVDPMIEIVDAAVPVPPAVVVQAAEIVTGGPRAVALEGALVRVNDVLTVSTTSPGQPGEDVANEFLVDANLPVDDGLFLIDPQPTLGQEYTTIAGVLSYEHGRNKLLPRSVDDFLIGPAGLVEFLPSLTYTYAGDSGSTSPPLTVRFGAAVASPIFVDVTSDDPTIAAVQGGGVSLGPGERIGEVLIDGLQVGGPIDLSASYDLTILPATIVVLDPTVLPRPVSVMPAVPSALVGSIVSATVAIDIPARPPGQEVDIGIVSELGGAAAVAPPTVRVPAGGFAIPFAIYAGSIPGRVRITATIGADFAEAQLDIDAYADVGLLLVEAMYDPSSYDTGGEWVRLYNGTDAAVDLGGYSLGWGGTSYLTGLMQLTGTVAAHSCVVIGGPNSNDDNGNPTIDLPRDFSPDLENATSGAGDAIGLFHGLARFLTAASIPTDAVVWGSSNQTGFVDANNVAFSGAHVPVGPSGWSIRRTSLLTWEQNPTPNSQACIIIAR